MHQPQITTIYEKHCGINFLFFFSLKCLCFSWSSKADVEISKSGQVELFKWQRRDNYKTPNYNVTSKVFIIWNSDGTTHVT